jgi:arylsulfatase A-like enzyme
VFFHGYDTHGQAALPANIDPRSLMPAYKGSLNGSVEEQAKLREQGLAAIKNPGDPSSLIGVLTPEDTAFLTAIYDKKIELADQRVGAFLDLLHSTGVWDHAIVVLLSDHGEEFMDRSALDHGQTLYQEQLHVPFMVHFPGQTQEVDIQDPVLTLNVFPTIFDALGLPAVPEADGQSLLPLIRGKGPAPGPLFSESDYRLFVHLRSLRKGDYKLILNLGNGQKSLYDLSKDPGETTDLAASQPKIAYEMEQELRAKMLSFGTDPATYLGRSETPITIF